jgi:hypothetical protein
LAQYVGNVDGELRHDVERDKGRGYRNEHRPAEPPAGPRLHSDILAGEGPRRPAQRQVIRRRKPPDRVGFLGTLLGVLDILA